jgi:hypothetical protein
MAATLPTFSTQPGRSHPRVGERSFADDVGARRYSLPALAAYLATKPLDSRYVFAFLSLALSVYVLLAGPHFSSDSRSYSYWADRLIANGYDVPEVLGEYGNALAATYLLFVTGVIVLKLVLGTYWFVGLIIINILAIAGVGTLVTRLSVRLFDTPIAGWASLALYAVCHDIWKWSPYVLSDPSFLLFAYCVFLMEGRRLLQPAKSWLPVFGASAAATLFRPTGIVLFPVTAWSFLLSRTRATPTARSLLLAGLFAAGIAAALLFGWFMQDPGRWPVGFASVAIRKIADGYAAGQVVWDRVATYHAPPHALADFWAITLDRFVHFFALGPSEYSAAHWVIQSIFYGPVYAFSAYFMVILLAGKSALSKEKQSICYVAAGAIILYAFFHAMIQVDYDWRYRIPILPHFVLLASGGVAHWMARRGIVRGSRSSASSSRHAPQQM